MANGIPEWLTLELILGVYASIISSLTFILYFIKLRREKPQLAISFVECLHTYSKPAITDWLLYFRPRIRIDNTGDRGTTVSKVEIMFNLNNKEFTEIVEGDSLQNNKIGASSTLDLNPLIYSYDDTILEFKKQERIECTFTLFHTHGKVTIEGTSKMLI